MHGEFKAFLLKNNVVSLAVAFILGAAVGKVVSVLVADLIMPVVGIFVPGGEWRLLAFQFGGAKLLVGDFLGSLLDFMVVALVVFLIAKSLLKPAPTPETKTCPFCLEAVAKAATRCKFCTQVVG
ncbi:MAG: large conductance mechanosensitive channel protein MscL [Acidobacteriota bacterium]|nr:large conductance mechanosensitive channel protein MscL [Acidobacteriota bacterium]